MNFAIVVVVVVVVVDVVVFVVDVVVVVAKVNLSFKKRSKFLSSSRFELRTSPNFFSSSFYRQALVELAYL